ncbi:hypothetical protein [Caballeronia sp. J97]|uniref:hypothetical protein n=1 Tax=Caballeronia sp. J97 TaxID=2805429 RepID=UPI002AB12DF7|nr:hypothetical protein [Caballeronia sp. J97]
MSFHIISSGEFGYSGAFPDGNGSLARADRCKAFAALLTIRIRSTRLLHDRIHQAAGLKANLHRAAARIRPV